MNILLLLPGSCAIFLFIVAGFIFLKAPENWPTRFLAIGLICYAVAEGFFYFLLNGYTLAEPSTWAGLALAFEALALPHWLLFSQRFGRSGAERESNRGLIFVSYGVAALIFSLILSPRLISQVDLATERIVLGEVGYLFPAYSLLVSAILLSNIERTFKAADRRQRWYLKFTILALAAIFGSKIYLDSQALLFSSFHLDNLFLFSAILFLGSFMLIFSMFRGGVPEVQVYLSGRFIYRSLTIFMVGIYLTSTAFTAYGIRLVGGAAYLFTAPLFVFIALLALAFFLLSEEVRWRLRRFVYSHFFRQQYDYREKWMEVTQKFGSKITTAEIGKALLGILEETLGVNALTVWLRSERRDYQLVYSLGLSPERLEGVAPEEELVRTLETQQGPLPIYDLKREGNEKERFLEVIEPQVIVPIFSDTDLLGMITLGRRICNAHYSLEDLDLLGTIARQAASTFQTARLSEQLLAAKEVESFHLLSAFFIHDLKNFASTLSLISENNKKRFDDPEFRTDALEGIRRITGQIQAMVSKLAAVSRQILIAERTVDLSSIVTTVVDEMTPIVYGKIETDLTDSLSILADPHLIQNSIRNLVLNASEALNGHGRITLRGWREKEMVRLTVEDNGCGMSPSFLQNDLFKPFRTTKPNGAGIGLFQVKKIIEAHRGTLEVRSEEGVGTTFTLSLPAGHTLIHGDRR